MGFASTPEYGIDNDIQVGHVLHAGKYESELKYKYAPIVTTNGALSSIR